MGNSNRIRALLALAYPDVEKENNAEKPLTRTCTRALKRAPKMKLDHPLEQSCSLRQAATFEHNHRTTLKQKKSPFYLVLYVDGTESAIPLTFKPQMRAHPRRKRKRISTSREIASAATLLSVELSLALLRPNPLFQICS